MLFDLRGKRRRAVQGTYLMLALLLGGGLVLFGIGGDVQGGLVDAFKGGGDDNAGNEVIEKRIERDRARVKRNPNDKVAIKNLVRDNYGLATAQTDQQTTGFPRKARDELRTASSWWQRYLKVEDGKVDASLATVALQIYDPSALNKPKDAQRAAAVIAESKNSPSAYLNLVQYATLAGDKRTAGLAGQKAIELAPKAQRKAIRAQVKQAKQPPQAQQAPQG